MDSLDMMLNIGTRKEKIDKLVLIKKCLCMKDSIKKARRQTKKTEENMYKSDKVLISRVYIERTLRSKNKKTNNLIKKWAKN